MLRRWVSTVFSLRKSSPAIERFVWRSVTSSAISRSRPVSSARPAAAGTAADARLARDAVAELAQLLGGLLAHRGGRAWRRAPPRRRRARAVAAPVSPEAASARPTSTPRVLGLEPGADPLGGGERAARARRQRARDVAAGEPHDAAPRARPGRPAARARAPRRPPPPAPPRPRRRRGRRRAARRGRAAGAPRDAPGRSRAARPAPPIASSTVARPRSISPASSSAAPSVHAGSAGESSAGPTSPPRWAASSASDLGARVVALLERDPPAAPTAPRRRGAGCRRRAPSPSPRR